MEPILITPVSEREVSRTRERAGSYEVIFGYSVDQYGRQWHSFHRVFEPDKDKPQDEPPASEAGSEN